MHSLTVHEVGHSDASTSATHRARTLTGRYWRPPHRKSRRSNSLWRAEASRGEPKRSRSESKQNEGRGRPPAAGDATCLGWLHLHGRARLTGAARRRRSAPRRAAIDFSWRRSPRPGRPGPEIADWIRLGPTPPEKTRAKMTAVSNEPPNPERHTDLTLPARRT